MRGMLKVGLSLALMVGVMCGCEDGGGDDGEADSGGASHSWSAYAGYWTGSGSHGHPMYGNFRTTVRVASDTGRVTFSEGILPGGAVWAWNNSRHFVNNSFDQLVGSIDIQLHSPTSGTVVYSGYLSATVQITKQ